MNSLIKLKKVKKMKGFFVSFITLFAVSVGSSAQSDSWVVNTLVSNLDSLVKYELPEGSNVGLSIYDLHTNLPLYTYQADKLSRPASTMKLLTAITALNRPDGDEPFRTKVCYVGTIAGDTLKGDLYVVGGYDPEFDDKAMDALVEKVTRFPIKVIMGNIYGDVSMKDSLYWGKGWAWDDTPESYQPYLSPLMLNKGVLTITAYPQSKGKAAILEYDPLSSYYKIINETVSKTPSASRFSVTRDWLQNGNNVVVSGNVASKCSKSVNLYCSQNFFMHTFIDRLLQKGIDCSEYGFKRLPYDQDSKLIGVVETPVQNVINRLMKESDNLNGQALLCRLGAQFTGKNQISDEDGLEAIRALIRVLGDDSDRYKLADGCGLSNYNYISPDLLVTFLKHAYSHSDIFQKLYSALPIGGVDGTLRNRMKLGTLSNRMVHAKTGSFTGINCLAGYLTANNGHLIAFAIMNQNVLWPNRAREFQDAVCDEIIKWAE